MSGPIAVVVAGILVGNRGPKDALSDVTQRHLFGFWTLVDQILNSILSMLTGSKLSCFAFDPAYVPVSLLAIPVAVGARFVATASAVATFKRRYSFQRGTTVVPACDSLRGGVPIALALSLPDTEWKPLLLSATDCVVVFSIFVQWLTLGRMASHVLERDAASG